MRAAKGERVLPSCRRAFVHEAASLSRVVRLPLDLCRGRGDVRPARGGTRRGRGGSRRRRHPEGRRDRAADRSEGRRPGRHAAPARRAEAESGGTDVPVSNAGVMMLSPVAESDNAMSGRQVAVNLKGTFDDLRGAARRLRRGPTPCARRRRCRSVTDPALPPRRPGQLRQPRSDAHGDVPHELSASRWRPSTSRSMNQFG
jgi:NAD(P)-dependent dehydrogenase (short-subunit alcohol dehydrogenase family)